MMPLYIIVTLDSGDPEEFAIAEWSHDEYYTPIESQLTLEEAKQLLFTLVMIERG